MLSKIYYLLFLSSLIACTQPAKERPAEPTTTASSQKEIQPGAWQIEEYIDLLRDKKVGLLVNHTSMVRETHLVDTLLSLGIDIKTVFAPEHGFKGMAADGEHVADQKMENFQMISLFGKKRKPTNEDLEGLDVVVFDIQDVGTRFFTYISTMHYMMEACARNAVDFIVLDRPNPNGSFVDGPFLEEKNKSFVGLHPIPTVHGLTVGELAQMIQGEDWLGEYMHIDLSIILVKNWNHSMPYYLPIKPSPNLPDDRSIALYPSICLFEGTIISEGRGTDFPFQQIGHPDYPDTSFYFIPELRQGSSRPKHLGQKCYGLNFKEAPLKYEFNINYVIDTYEKMGKPDNFFTPHFKLLVGDMDEQIKAGMTAQEIRATWQADLEAFKELRHEYLLYDYD